MYAFALALISSTWAILMLDLALMIIIPPVGLTFTAAEALAVTTIALR